MATIVARGTGSDNHTQYISKRIGTIWYIDIGAGSDTNTGKYPSDAFKTIKHGIDTMSDGDVLTIKAGTYTETGLVLSNTSSEIWFDIGVILNPASGTGLTISGANCKILAKYLKITPAQDTTGLLCSGAFCYLEGIRIPCDGGAVGTSADLGFDLTGAGIVIKDCHSSGPDIAAFKLQGDKIKIFDCTTGGNSGYSSIGFWITNSLDKLRMKRCSSQGHETSGFQVDSGCTNGIIDFGSSGGGDGRWSDADNSFVWSNFTFDDEVYKHTNWASVGGAAGTHNLFKITGSVEIRYIFGDVDTQIHADVNNIYLELDDGTNQISVTGQVAGGVDTNSAEVGSLFIKTLTSASNMVLMQADQIRFNEDSSGQKGGSSFIVNQKAGANSYIRVGWTGTGNTGDIHWHCQWEPVSEAGFVEPA